MGRFDSAGAGAARGIRTGFGINAAVQDKKSREDEAAQKRAEKFKEANDAARDSAIENVTQFSELASKAAEKGATPEQLEEFRTGAMASSMAYGQMLEGYRKQLEGFDEDPSIVPSGGEFVDEQMALFDASVQSASIEDTSEDFETLSPEDVAEMGFPEGAIVQRGPDEKITLTFDPSTDKTLSSFQEQVNALIPFVGEEAAIGIKAGRFGISVSPITNEAFVMDLATGERVGEVQQPTEPAQTPPVVTPDTDPTAAVGGAGFLQNAANIVTDAVGAGAAFEDTQQATTALNVIQQQTKLLLQAVVPGRPAKDIREGLKKLTVTPNSLFQGEARAKSSLEGTKRMIDNEIARMENMLQTEISPQERSAINANLGPLKEISRSHQDLIDAFDKEEEVDPELEGLLEKYAPEGN